MVLSVVSVVVEAKNGTNVDDDTKLVVSAV